MMYKQKPDGFRSEFDIVSCFVEYNGEILLLHRRDHKPDGNTWGVPAGKVDSGEEPLQAIARELQEETGIMAQPKDLIYFGKSYVRYPNFDFIYYVFHLPLKDRPRVMIRPDEHKDSIWVEPQKALKMNLIQDEDESIRIFYKI
ncbi:NUDIX hydrolase [Patescibacteria group bacterium]|nr:NUDIX hydrolase [Patescibacteria group bacterium]